MTAEVASRPGADATKGKHVRGGNDSFHRNEKKTDIVSDNISQASAVSDTILTSLGPRGMDKMIQDAKGNVIITNDGATILKEMKLKSPVAKMIVELSKAQDIAAGDGTTSVVVLAGSLLKHCQRLLQKGIHPQQIVNILGKMSHKSLEIIRNIAKPILIDNKDQLLNCAITSLNSKVVVQNAPQLAQIAVDAVLHLHNANKAERAESGDKADNAQDGQMAGQTLVGRRFAPRIDLEDIKVVSKLGGTVEDCELVKGVVFTKRFANMLKNPPNVADKTKVASLTGRPDATSAIITQAYSDVKVGLIQFCVSSPKTDMDNTIKICDFQSMDRVLKEERKIVAKMVKTIAATGCNILLVQKSVLREAISDLALDFFTKSNILVLRDIDRDEVEFISKLIGCQPAASLDHFTAASLGTVGLVSEEDIGGSSKIIRMSQCNTKSSGITILVRGSNQLILGETIRSIHDALCVVRCLLIDSAIVPGGGAVEMELYQKLNEWARTLSGKEEICIKQLAEAFTTIPDALAENAALPALEIVTELKKQHNDNNPNLGIDVKKSTVADMMKLNVVSPILVFNSATTLAIETVKTILKIDDIIITR